MKNTKLILVLLTLMPGTLMAQHPAASGQAPHAAVTSITSKDLPEFPGKEALMILVDYPPGAVDPIQCACLHLCVGGFNHHAGEKWKGSDPDTGPDFL